MRMDKNIVRDAIARKLEDQIFYGYVAEAYIRALPIDKTTLSTELTELNRYAFSTLKSLHGADLLRSAMESNTPTMASKIYLETMYNAVHDIALEAAIRITAEKLNDPLSTTKDDIVDNAAFTPDEINKIVKRGADLELPEVAQIIQKKVINAIKAEKETIEKDNEMKRELTEALSTGASSTPENNSEVDTENESSQDVSLESYLNLILDFKSPRAPISFLSKLQDVAVEALLHTSEDYNEIPYGVVKKITTEASLGVFDPTIESIESRLKSMAIVSESYHGEEGDEEHHENKMKHVAKTAMLCSIIIYTMLETLKAMRLFNPSKDTIKQFVDSPNGMAPLMGSVNQESIINDVKSHITDNLKALNKVDSALEVDELAEKVTEIRSLVEKLPPEYEAVKEALFPQLDHFTEAASAQKKNIDKLKVPAAESYFTSRNREANIAEMNRVANVYGARPIVNEIRVRVDPADESTSMLDIEYRDISGKLIDTSFVTLNRDKEFGDLMTCATEAMASSALASIDKTVNIYYYRKNYMVPLEKIINR